MQNKLLQYFDRIFFWTTGILSLLLVFAGWYFEQYYLLAAPFFLLFCCLALIDFKIIFFLLIALLPVSIEYTFPNGLGTDLPAEPIMVFLMLLLFFKVVSQKNFIEKDFITHPLFTVLLFHWLWIVIAAVYSSLFIVSFKFLLAKTWYISVFAILGGVIIKERKDFVVAFWCFVLPLFFTVVFTIVKHATYHFSFATVNTMMQPFFPNHVIYAATVALAIPFIWVVALWYPKKSFKRRFLYLMLLLFVVAVFLSYTRSAWLSLIVAVVFVFIIQKKIMKGVITGGVVMMLSFIGYMAWKNHYLNYAPDYEQTIMHEELGDHLQATYNMEDISSEERVYRWVAGFRMWQANPVVGYGPGNFYNFYKPYTVSRFRTYVSANTERSTVHNYFLLTLVEQGIIGLLIFLTLTIMLLMNGQRIYHETKDKKERQWVMAIMLCIIIIYVSTFLSDLLEVAKIGTIFFLCIAMLVNQDLRNKKLLKQS